MMKESSLYKYEFLLPIFASILYFFTVKQVIPRISYTVIASLFGIYFFPVKLFFYDDLSDNSLKSRITEFISVLVFASIMAFSILILFEKENAVVHILFEMFSIINLLFLLFYSVRDKRSNTFITHLGFTVLAAAVFGV